jgi:hypothetical protein
VLVLVERQHVGASVTYLVALGMFAPRYPDFESVQDFIRRVAPDIVNLNVDRTDVAFGPVYDISGAPCRAKGRKGNY